MRASQNRRKTSVKGRPNTSTLKKSQSQEYCNFSLKGKPRKRKQLHKNTEIFISIKHRIGNADFQHFPGVFHTRASRSLPFKKLLLDLGH